MQHWLIIRSDFKKEHAVAIQIGKKGYPVWVPVQIITGRHPAARRHMDRSNAFQTRERPVCPSLLFAAVPVDDVDRIMGIRHLTRVEQTAEGLWAQIPDEQIRVFREAIAAENLAAQMLTAAARRKKKARWRSLEEGLMSLVQETTNPMEEAA